MARCAFMGAAFMVLEPAMLDDGMVAATCATAAGPAVMSTGAPMTPGNGSETASKSTITINLFVAPLLTPKKERRRSESGIQFRRNWENTKNSEFL